MTDVFSKEKRSEVMAKIRGSNTKPELLVRKYIFKQGLRYRINDKNLPGTPDLVFKKFQTVIFVHGCFWHGHSSLECRISRMPKTNIEYWKAKIANNQSRDHEKQEILDKLGWKIITVWECELRGSKRNKTLKRIVENILKVGRL